MGFKTNIDYSAIAYIDKLSKTQIHELTKLQKNAIRLIFSAKRSVHTDKLFKLASIRPIDKIYLDETIKFVFKYLNDTNNELPREIGKLLFEGSSNTHNLRYYDSRSNIKISDKFQKGNCMYNIIQAWNQADSSLKSA